MSDAEHSDVSMSGRFVLVSDSFATDGGFIAIADIAGVIEPGSYRLIGGIAVMLDVQRHGLDVPIRATGDADFGVLGSVLVDEKLVSLIAGLHYLKTKGNRWERVVDDRRTAVVDVLIPAYSSRPRSSVQVGSVNTAEVGGLAIAFTRPGVAIDTRMVLTDGPVLDATVVIPDESSMLVMKTYVRRVRHESRDAEDLWRCLEAVYAAGAAEEFRTEVVFADAGRLLRHELAPNGPAMHEIVRDVQDGERARRRTRITALLNAVAGP